jgi:SAM-dependent methyltransferase
MINPLVSAARYIAYRTPILAKILKDRVALNIRLIDVQHKNEQLLIELESKVTELTVLRGHLNETDALTSQVERLGLDITGFHQLVREHFDRLSVIHDLIAAQSDDILESRKMIENQSYQRFRFHDSLSTKIEHVEDLNSNIPLIAEISEHLHTEISSGVQSEIYTDSEEIYLQKLSQEVEIFSDDNFVHNLPDIFHYWSNRHLKPMIEEIGCEGVDHFYAKYLMESAMNCPKPYSFVSIGSGNGDVEINVAKLLIGMGLDDFSIECLEYNDSMIERGRSEAVSQGLGKFISFTKGDFNNWKPTRQYSGVMANHSLHHVVNLEGLFDTVKSALHPDGYFVTGDMVGRNGHQRWPEAKNIVDQFWSKLDEKYHYNHQLKRQEPVYIDHDCSSEGFEGIRAQDIMEHLLLRFHFKIYVGFLNVISPFIDRSFGHNFNINNPIDCAFIDAVHQADEEGFQSGILKPTQIFAVMSLKPVDNPFYSRGISPGFSVRTAA